MDLLNCVCKIDGTWLKSSYYYTICKMLGILRHYTYIASRITFKRLTFSIYKGRTFSSLLLVLYWTGTWWSGADERVKEGKRLIFPGLHSRLSRSRESAREREREREGERERERGGPKLWWSKGALLNSVRVSIPVASLDKHQETRLYKFIKEARSNRGHTARRRSIWKEGRK